MLAAPSIMARHEYAWQGERAWYKCIYTRGAPAGTSCPRWECVRQPPSLALQRHVSHKLTWSKICCCFPYPCLLLDWALRYFLGAKINIKGIRSILEVGVLAFFSNSATEGRNMVFFFKEQLLQMDRMDQKRPEMPINIILKFAANRKQLCVDWSCVYS